MTASQSNYGTFFFPSALIAQRQKFDGVRETTLNLLIPMPITVFSHRPYNAIKTSTDLSLEAYYRSLYQPLAELLTSKTSVLCTVIQYLLVCYG